MSEPKYDFEAMELDCLKLKQLRSLIEDDTLSLDFWRATLDGLFIWTETPQGYAFWEAVFREGFSGKAKEAIREIVAQAEEQELLKPEFDFEYMLFTNPLKIVELIKTDARDTWARKLEIVFVWSRTPQGSLFWEEAATFGPNKEAKKVLVRILEQSKRHDYPFKLTPKEIEEKREELKEEMEFSCVKNVVTDIYSSHSIVVDDLKDYLNPIPKERWTQEQIEKGRILYNACMIWRKDQ